jgi:hypothetical protein
MPFNCPESFSDKTAPKKTIIDESKHIIYQIPVVITEIMPVSILKEAGHAFGDSQKNQNSQRQPSPNLRGPAFSQMEQKKYTPPMMKTQSTIS